MADSLWEWLNKPLFPVLQWWYVWVHGGGGGGLLYSGGLMNAKCVFEYISSMSHLQENKLSPVWMH